MGAEYTKRYTGYGSTSDRAIQSLSRQVKHRYPNHTVMTDGNTEKWYVVISKRRRLRRQKDANKKKLPKQYFVERYKYTIDMYRDNDLWQAGVTLPRGIP